MGMRAGFFSDYIISFRAYETISRFSMDRTDMHPHPAGPQACNKPLYTLLRVRMTRSLDPNNFRITTNLGQNTVMKALQCIDDSLPNGNI